MKAEEYLKSKDITDMDYMDSGMVDHILELLEEFATHKLEEYKQSEESKGLPTEKEIDDYINGLDIPDNQDQYTFDTAFKKGVLWVKQQSEPKEESKEFEINFDGNVKTKVLMTQNTPTILAAMNGYGHMINIDNIEIKPIK